MSDSKAVPEAEAILLAALRSANVSKRKAQLSKAELESIRDHVFALSAFASDVAEHFERSGITGPLTIRARKLLRGIYGEEP